MPITIKELKEKIMSLPDDMKVGALGHFGEYLECFEAEVLSAEVKGESELIFCINIEYAGETPC